MNSQIPMWASLVIANNFLAHDKSLQGLMWIILASVILIMEIVYDMGKNND